MKGFVKGYTKAVTNLERTFEDAVKTTLKPDATQADIDEAWAKVSQASQDTNQTARDAAREEWREHVLKNLQDSGMSKEEAEKWFIDHWEKVKSMADKGIKYASKAGLAAKAGALALFAAVTALVGSVLSKESFDSGQQTRQWSSRMDRTIDQARTMDQLSVSQQEFMQMGNTLSLSAQIPPEAFQPPAAAAAAPAPPAPAPAPAALPAPVAAVAGNPVQVEVNNNGRTYTGRTTIREFYRAVPQARPQIQWHIEHDYDNPAWYRLGPQPQDNWHDSPNHHVNIDVDAGFASAHFHM